MGDKSTYLSILVALFLLQLCSASLVIENELDNVMECVGNFESFILQPKSSYQLFGNGRCATTRNDGNQSLVEWNFAEDKIFVDISLVDACTFAADISSGNTTFSTVRCSCVTKPLLSECTKTRLPQYCCLAKFGSEQTCDVNNSYYELLSSCSVGVYKYAYDDVSGLKVFNNTESVRVLVYDDNRSKENDKRSPSNPQRSSTSALLVNPAVECSLCFRLPLEVISVIYYLVFS